MLRWDGAELRTRYPQETMQRKMFLLRIDNHPDVGRIAKYVQRGMQLVPPPPEVQGLRRLSAAVFADLLEEVQQILQLDSGPSGGEDADTAGDDDDEDEVEVEAAAPAP